LVRAVLISLRDPEDLMAEHERICFAECARLKPAEIDLHHICQSTPSLSKLEDIGAVFFGGSGAYSVLDPHDWIKNTVTLMLNVVERKIPSYASCFGFQGLAMALGGLVERDDALTEMGSFELQLTPEGLSDTLFSSLPQSFWAQEGHHDHVTRLPSGITLLASGKRVQAQAFRVNGAPFWASQFHPELDYEKTIERFRYYSEQYLDENHGTYEDAIAKLKGGPNSPEVPELLARLVRGTF
jgi:GMP synthase (glutamine-hydrolysing)